MKVTAEFAIGFAAVCALGTMFVLCVTVAPFAILIAKLWWVTR